MPDTETWDPLCGSPGRNWKSRHGSCLEMRLCVIVPCDVRQGMLTLKKEVTQFSEVGVRMGKVAGGLNVA